MKKVIIGLSMIVVGCLTLIVWWKKLLYIIVGVLPVVLITGGMLILSAGIRQVENLKIKNKSDIHTAKQKLEKPDEHSEQ
ncbi:MAG: hypothetical protein GF384_04785 [Elusimicrobia bacterium]|nr:hypothetical protein [Elusimicrobiota bacterium]MBD3412140.1 hypothetical protein [Elusimicrobiota bacterium]